MEAVRPSSIAQRNDNGNISDSTTVHDELPPPPAPFPMEMISSSTSAPATSAKAHSHGSKTSQYLSSVQQSCVDALSVLLPSDERQNTLSRTEGQLASALTELLEVTYELESFLPATMSTITNNDRNDVGLEESFDNLLNHLQSTPAPIYKEADRPQNLHPAINVVREQLAWARLESLSTAILQLVERGRQNESDGDALPPCYDQHHNHNCNDNGNQQNGLPAYHDTPSTAANDTTDEMNVENTKPDQGAGVARHPSSGREKMLHDLEAVTNAIERLYSVAPQLNDQRSELRVPSSTTVTNGESSGSTKMSKAEIERLKMRELEEIWDKIERSHGKRRMRDDDGQRADSEQLEQRRRERNLNKLSELRENLTTVDDELARARQLRDSDHILRDLIGQQEGSNQDAESSSSRQFKLSFINDVIARSRAGRMSGQDFPLSAEDKLLAKRNDFIDELVGFGESGRMTDQDTLPPTPKTFSGSKEKELDPFELVTAHDFLIGMKATTDDDGLEQERQPISSASASRSRSNSLPLDEAQSKRLSGSVAFQKIAGMVKRGSAHLGIKTGGGFDPSNLVYVAEHQENIRVIQIMLHGPTVVSNLDLEMEIGGPTEIIISSKKDTSINVRLSLPAPVSNHESATLIPQSLHLEGKLSALPLPSTPGSSSFPSLTYALSGTELRELRPKAICCTSCDRELADVSIASRDDGGGYKDLPSEHWAEMMEVWMCHDDPTFTASLARMTKEGFWPKDGNVLVGGSYLLVQGDKVKKSNLTKDPTNNDSTDTWTTVSCSCGEVVGKKRNDDGKPGSKTMRFSKWAIALLRSVEGSDQEDSDESVEYPLSVFVVSDMLELAQAHASYKFIISDESGCTQIYIWLFNPSIRIAYRKPTPSSPLHNANGNGNGSSHANGENSMHRSRDRRRSSVISTTSTTTTSKRNGQDSEGGVGGCTVLRAAKIMYRVAQGTDDQQSLPGFKGENQVEQLSYPNEVCERLINSLKESTAVYPLSRRTMGAFDVGFLERT